MTEVFSDPVAATVAVYDADPVGFVSGWDRVEPGASGATDLVAELADVLPDGAAVLDVGCGSGRDLARMVDLGLRPVGLEPSAGLRAHAAARGPVVAGDVRDLPFADGMFAGVLASASLLHLPRGDVAGALGEIVRVLRPGGLLACNVKRRMPGMFDGPDGRGRHFTYFDDRELDGLLADAGLRVALASTDADASRPDTCWLARVAERC